VTLKFKCPKCKTTLNAKEQVAGKRLNCGKCGETITVPTPPKKHPESSHRCPHCDTEVDVGESLCPVCGHNFAAGERVLSAARAETHSQTARTQKAGVRPRDAGARTRLAIKGPLAEERLESLMSLLANLLVIGGSIGFL